MILDFQESIEKYSTEVLNNTAEIIKIRNCIKLLLDLIFFFSSVHVTIISSEKLAKTIIVVDELFNEYLTSQVSFIRSFIMGNINKFSIENIGNDEREKYISIERLNIILSTSEFGHNYLLDKSYFSKIVNNSQLDYFTIISLLYYFKDHDEYHKLKQIIEQKVTIKLESNLDYRNTSENAHLFLDLMSCKYVSNTFKKERLNSFIKFNKNTINTTDLNQLILDLEDTYWFVKWQNLNLLKLIERKELKSAY